ncbi:MAG: hypothetical protein ACUVT7_01590 [Thermoplasmata archaeon]
MKPKSKLSDSVWTAFTEAIRFVVIPMVLVNLVADNYPQLSTAFLPNIKTYIMFFGGMIVAASTLESMNRPGTYKRLLFGLSALAFVCMWLFVIFGGGIAEFAYGPYFVRFDMSKIVYIMLFGLSLKALLVYTTFSAHKRVLEDEERRTRLERAREKALAKPKLAHPPHYAMPSFSALSKVAFEVTADDTVGFTPAPPPTRAQVQSAKVKHCRICGARAERSDYVCKVCGAWFSKDSFRFKREP